MCLLLQEMSNPLLVVLVFVMVLVGVMVLVEVLVSLLIVSLLSVRRTVILIPARPQRAEGELLAVR